MQCEICSKESQWLEIIGINFVCSNCVNKSKIMGYIFRTDAKIFRAIVEKSKIRDYQALLDLTRKDIDNVIDLKKCGIILKTTNVVHID